MATVKTFRLPESMQGTRVLNLDNTPADLNADTGYSWRNSHTKLVVVLWPGQ